jgi:site-specific recombinase XerD
MDNWKNKLVNELKLRGYSRKTINAYLFYVSRFINSGLEPKTFLLKLVNDGKSKSTVRVAGFAVKFYLKNVRGKGDNFLSSKINEIPNMKEDKKLPVVLSKKEIGNMIMATKNLSHRLMIQIMYSSGLRVSEVINLKWEDIDFNRNIIHLKLAKGGKDRIVMLSPKVKKSLVMFCRKKEGLIFVSNRNKKYSLTTIEKVVSNVAKKAGVTKKVTPHSLRHSFATHLLENGTDIRYIRDLLGHSRVETTMIYTKVSNRDISKIKSPIDF